MFIVKNNAKSTEGIEQRAKAASPPPASYFPVVISVTCVSCPSKHTDKYSFIFLIQMGSGDRVPTSQKQGVSICQQNSLWGSGMEIGDL